jgi:hypothetical protein
MSLIAQPEDYTLQSFITIALVSLIIYSCYYFSKSVKLVTSVIEYMMCGITLIFVVNSNRLVEVFGLLFPSYIYYSSEYIYPRLDPPAQISIFVFVFSVLLLVLLIFLNIRYFNVNLKMFLTPLLVTVILILTWTGFDLLKLEAENTINYNNPYNTAERKKALENYLSKPKNVGQLIDNLDSYKTQTIDELIDEINSKEKSSNIK